MFNPRNISNRFLKKKEEFKKLILKEVYNENLTDEDMLIPSLGNIKYIDGSVKIGYSENSITTLESLIYISKNLSIGPNISSINNLKYVGGWIYIVESGNSDKLLNDILQVDGIKKFRGRTFVIYNKIPITSNILKPSGDDNIGLCIFKFSHNDYYGYYLTVMKLYNTSKINDLFLSINDFFFYEYGLKKILSKNEYHPPFL